MFSIDVLHIAWSVILFCILVYMFSEGERRHNAWKVATPADRRDGMIIFMYSVAQLALIVGSVVVATWIIGFSVRVIANMLAA